MSEFDEVVPRVYSTSQYGAAANNLPDCTDEKFYISTAIAYTNGLPHFGHAYEFLTADVLARFHRILGKKTFFLTGTDEHGQKVAASAEKNGKKPIEHCDFYVAGFKELHEKLLVTYSDFMRTTNPYHEKTSQDLWEMCAKNDDIYLDSYEGWYNEREETFVSDAEAAASDFKDPGNGQPLKRVTEESYFFRMSKYCDRLISHIKANPQFIQPELHRNIILSRLEKEGLKDLSISRTSFDWGIPVPKGFDPKHVMYVWFDALTNYLSGVHGLDANHPLSQFWPAQIHLIGKDIVWFHSVIWPCMLMSAGVALPETVFSHGFVNGPDGRKMSKTYGNTVDPIEILKNHSVDTLRYYMCGSITFGADINFSKEGMITMHNSELADILGNLVHRVLTLAQKFCNGVIPDVPHDAQYSSPFDLKALKEGITQDLKDCLINNAIFKAMEAARATNRFLTEAEPWKMKGENESRRVPVVRTALEAVYAFSHFLAPVLPVATQQIFEHLHTEPVSVHNLRDDFYNLKPGTPITIGNILFQKIEDPNDAATTGDNKAKAPAAGKKGAPSKNAPVEEVQHSIDFTKMDIRVGEIVKVWNHETAERLYCEHIDVGDATGPRQVASGLRKNYTLEQMQNRKVIVVCNLKESKFQGFMSCGMVLAAKSADGEIVELLSPPEGSKVGERVFLQGYESFAEQKDGIVWEANKIKKMKVWEAVAPSLSTNEEGVPTWNGNVLQTSAGPLIAASLKSVHIQ